MFTMVVGGLGLAKTPFILSEENTDCFATKTIRVPVPVGESRHIEITRSGSAGGSTAQTYTINSQTDILIELDAEISSNQVDNTEFSTVYCLVRLGASGSPVFTSGLTRQHSINKC